MRSSERECVSNAFRKHEGPWFRLECSTCHLCNTYCIVYSNKEQNQNASLHTYFKRTSSLSLGLLQNPSQCADHLFHTLGDILQQVWERALLLVKSRRQPVVHPARWREPGNFPFSSWLSCCLCLGSSVQLPLPPYSWGSDLM